MRRGLIVAPYATNAGDIDSVSEISITCVNHMITSRPRLNVQSDSIRIAKSPTLFGT